MTDLYLIAHKVRGEPAFDVAEQMPCPMCAMEPEGSICHECDSLGYWWIIPTSGHRAYPYAECALESIFEDAGMANWPGPVPDALPDHYPHNAAPTRNLASLLGLDKRKPTTPTAPFQRRL